MQENLSSSSAKRFLEELVKRRTINLYGQKCKDQMFMNYLSTQIFDSDFIDSFEQRSKNVTPK